MRVRMSSVFSFSFFHSFPGFGGAGREDDCPTSPASSRLLFFNAPVFVLFTSEDFILLVTSIFTRIDRGLRGGDYDSIAGRSNLQAVTVAMVVEGGLFRSIRKIANAASGKTLRGFSFIY
jgi:hypothetical protein